MQNHYDILELDKNCSQSDIKKTYRRLAKEYHPDKNKKKGFSKDELDNLKDIYMKIHKAFEVLSDPELREEYDRSGISTKKGEQIIDPLEAMLKLREEANQTGVPDVIVPIDTTLINLYNGFSTEVEYQRITSCAKCKANGTRNKKKADCTNCDGRGMILENVEGGEMGYSYKESICDDCKGTGLDPDVKKCKECNGAKYKQESIICDVEIPKGAYEGYYIKLEAEGNFIPKENRLGKDVDRTDVLFVIADVNYENKNTDENNNLIIPTYRRGIVIKELKRSDRSDLMIEIKLSFEESICGITRKILHLDKSIIELDIDNPVTNADVIVLERKGMPICSEEVNNRKKKNLDSEFGDLFIKFKINRPVIDNSIKRKLWQVLTSTSYQKRDEIEMPCPFVFLDDMIKDYSDTKHKSDSGSDSGSGSDSDN